MLHTPIRTHTILTTMSDRSGSENRQRSSQIGLRLTEEEFLEIWKKAQEAGMGIQDYIRWQLLSDAPMA